MAVVWSVTVFLSAFLLFLVQPMMAKMILPMLGGTPAVWNTCMLFYQATLLAGYGYVHLLNSRVDPRRQLFLHLVLLAVPLLLLPIGLPDGWTPPDETNPVFWVLLLLTVAIGLPFFVLSTTAPLLQKWFSWTDHRHIPRRGGRWICRLERLDRTFRHDIKYSAARSIAQRDVGEVCTFAA